ncbi:SRPBCC family protein [Shimazuella alba]|uniref:ATPase n=1 Tax=Shimazuella alba TaxID=2690964 RepID=A0A6I4VRI7_9BACL|nr:SRPBCC domain-containing protein [Shimazuella alba]MXQ52496.1 ATPase [Shimazuella alba]
MNSKKTKITKNLKNRELIVERNIAVSRKLAWQGWTLPEHIENWWGPKNWSTTVYEMDVRAGGIWRYRIAPNDGKDEEARCKATYTQVMEQSKLVYTDTFVDRDWNAVEGSEMHTSVTFEDENRSTKLTITTQFASVEDLDSAETIGMIEGFTDALDRLEKYLHTS